MKNIIFIILGIILLAGISCALYYNSFVVADEGVNTAWSQVENQYQRRSDLIPNLVETVKGISNQEKAVFLGVAEARSKVGQVSLTAETLSNSEVFANFQNAQSELSNALSRLLVTVENYPQLRSNENFLALQSQLEGTENRISVERKRYNDVVKEYNIKAKGIPGKWFVSLFGFDKSKQLFESTDGAEKAPSVQF